MRSNFLGRRVVTSPRKRSPGCVAPPGVEAHLSGSSSPQGMLPQVHVSSAACVQLQRTALAGTARLRHQLAKGAIVAERTVLVCDTCAKPAVDTVTLVLGTRRRQRDYCRQHLDELLAGARAPRRGRRLPATGPGPSPKKSTRRRKVASKRSTVKSASAASTAKSGPGRSRSTTRKATTRSPATNATTTDVAAEVKKLRGQGLSYPQIGDRLLARGIKPQRSKKWNPIVLGRMAKSAA